MIWGLGTGRCGTRTAATLLGGLHEPRPKLIHHAVDFANHGAHRDALLDILGARLGLGVPAVVDLQQAFVVPAMASGVSSST